MIRILLAEDQAMVRGALTALLGLESDIEVLGAAADGEAAWRELLVSFAILDPVARQTGMYLTPRSEADSLLFRSFQPTSDLQPGTYILKADPTTKRYDLVVVRSREEASVETGTLGDSVGRTVG